MRVVIRSPNSLGAAIREARRKAGLTQVELGLKTGLRQATISSLENGEGGTLESLFKILAILQLDIDLDPRSSLQPDLDDLF